MAAPHPRAGAPLRGLAAFTEADRDALFGRDRDRDEIVKMALEPGFRAGLVFGEPGVGRTSLLHAAVLPALRDQGVTIVPCADPLAPAASFADALIAGGAMPNQGEAPLAFVARVIASAPADHLYLFVLDDADEAIARGGDRVVADLGDLFARVVSRGAGRARVLFACASERMHRFGQLERRTGSLFPPSSRHELRRFPPAEAAAVLERTLRQAGLPHDPELVDAVVSGLGRGGDVLPADLQIAALALQALRIGGAPALAKSGGASELEARWLEAAAAATGHDRTAMRVLGELAQEPPADDPGPRGSGRIAQRLGLAPGEAQRVLQVLEAHGIVAGAVIAGVIGDGPGGQADAWTLRHPILAPRIRELTAPARASARRAYDLLGSKAASGQRLTLRELRSLHSERIAPVTPAETDVVKRSRRLYLAIVGAIAAVPIVLLIVLWRSNAGRMYYDLEPGPGGDRIVVRAGRAGLSSFHWLPSSPGYGTIVADTGLSRSMVDPAAWRAIAAHDLGGALDGWARGVDELLRPELAALVRYATTGDELAVKQLAQLARDPEDQAELLAALRPIARGAVAEVAIVEEALTTPSPALSKAAVAVAGAAAQRGADAYRPVLVRALVSPDPELRRIALTAVRGLGEARARDLIEAALAEDPDPSARRELGLEASTAVADDGPSAASAVALLRDPDVGGVLRARARDELRRAIARAPVDGSAAATRLLADDAAPADARVFAAELLRETLADAPGAGLDTAAIGEAARGAYGAKAEPVRAAALPLYTMTEPARAIDELAALTGGTAKVKPAMRAAAARGWGELARVRPEDTTAALDRLLKDGDTEVRAAAATAYGALGRPAQETLLKMVKQERPDVALGAALGLVASVEAGAPPGVAMEGVFHLWKQKGRARRDAARAYARLARRRPGAVIDYLSAAARAADDASLHPIGVEGLCNAAAAGSADARKVLARVTDNPSTDVRRMIMRCIVDGPEPAKNGLAIASRLVKDPDPEIRADAARVLATAARAGKPSASVAEALVGRLEDPSRDVRLIAVRAVAGLGDAAPAATPRALADAFERADEGERRALLRAARDLGAGDLVQVAISDASPLVRVDAVDLALATGTRVAATVATALADADAQVRRAALERIAGGAGGMDAASIDRSLALAIRDPDPELSQLALTTLARVGDKQAVVARLGRALGSRAESERAKGAAAAGGLVDRDAALAAELLTPLLTDPSHDVRVAMLPSLGAAWASTNSPDQLAQLLRGSERDAMRRLVAAAAFVTLARTEGGRAAAEAALGGVAKKGPPMARRTAELTLGLIAARADGLGFLQQLVP